MWYFALFPGYSFIDISLLHSVLYNRVDTFNRHQRYSVSPLRNDRDSSFSKAFSGFSNSTVILVFGMLVIGNAMFESGVAQKIGNVVMRVSGGSERKFILFAGGTSIIMSMFLANMAVIAMYLAVMSSVCRTNPNVKLKNICLATTMGAMFGGVCTLVGSTPQLTMQTILEGAAGQTAGMWDFMPVGLCLSVVYLLYVLFIGYPLGKKIWEKDDGSENLDELDTLVASRAVKVEEDAGHKRKQIYMYIILVMLVVFFATEIVSNVIATCIWLRSSRRHRMHDGEERTEKHGLGDAHPPCGLSRYCLRHQRERLR